MSNAILWTKIKPHLKELQNPNGQGEYRALCPLHNDTEPSLDINPEKGVWYCHGACKRGGTLTDFARELGILNGKRPTEEGQKKPTTETEAWAELERRGLRKETLDHFKVTTDFEKKSWCWPVRGGMRFKKWPKYEGRKYWHYAGTPNRLYGLGSIPPEEEIVYYVSGEVDLWVMWQAGLPAVCHIFGEGNPPEDAGTELKARGFNEVRIVPDLDEAGQTQAARVTAALQGHNLIVKALSLPDFLGEKADLNDLYLWCDANDEIFRRAVEGLTATIPTLKPKELFRFNDVGNGLRLVARHGDIIRYCDLFGDWFIWDGLRWKLDDVCLIEKLAMETAAAIYEETKYTAPDNTKQRKAIADWAHSSEQMHRVRSMIAAARSRVSLIPSEMDNDNWIINCKNGVLDLKTGELLAHDPTRLITKLSPVEYDPDAKLPLWDSFLDMVTGGDGELLEYLQRAVGYTLVGTAGDEVLFFIHGPTATGKSTFIEAIRAMLGDYAKTADFETFLKSSNTGRPRSDVARLVGARLVVSLEVDEDKRLAVGLIKSLSAGDRITARFLHKNEFEFNPVFALWFAANHVPRMNPKDDAMWRRFKRIPFEQTIPPEKRDPEVKAILRDPELAGAAIMAWAVEGCLKWQQEGLGGCPAIERATDALREQMDPVHNFLEECCMLEQDAWTSSKELRQEYEDWARENGETILKGREWGDSLREYGCVPKLLTRQGKSTRGWQGIRRATDPDKQSALWGD